MVAAAMAVLGGGGIDRDRSCDSKCGEAEGTKAKPTRASGYQTNH
jgi:hypothetical protein